jgi:transposase InsO family protein
MSNANAYSVAQLDPAQLAAKYDAISEVQDIATEWLWTYNHDRLNMGIGGITPAQKLKLAA